jgi:hypothetical protein
MSRISDTEASFPRRLTLADPGAGVSSLEVGITLTKFVQERFDAQVIEYESDGAITSVRMRLPSRRQRWESVLERSRASLALASDQMSNSLDLIGNAVAVRMASVEIRDQAREARMGGATGRSTGRKVAPSRGK